MRYSQIRSMDISNGEGIGVSLFTQGCPFHCINCFNTETWDFEGGKLFGTREINRIKKLCDNPIITRFSILGGEPLIEQNLTQLTKLIKEIKIENPNIKIWLYTGHEFHVVWKSKYKAVIKQCDVVVDGMYVDMLKDTSLEFRGSKNQRIVDVKKSYEEGKVVLYELHR